jgi:hypothetical protein
MTYRRENQSHQPPRRRNIVGCCGFCNTEFPALDPFWIGNNFPTEKNINMKKVLAVSTLALSFVAGVAVAQVRDWHDLDKCHQHVIESIHEMERARAANHYDMDGHGAKAEEHLRAAERELGMAIDAARR